VILGELGIKYLTSRPYHPQTCGKVGRPYPNPQKRLPTLPRAHTIAELQYQLDDFLAYYNRIRPHRAIGRHGEFVRSSQHIDGIRIVRG